MFKKLQNIKWLWRKQRGEKASMPTTGVAFSGLSFANYSDANAYEFANEAFRINVISYICIDRIAKGLASVPWDLYKENSEGEKEKVVSHPSKKVLTRPNPLQSFRALLYSQTVYLLTTGDSWWKKVGPETGPNRGLAKELFYLRPDLMEIKVNPDTGIIEGYYYGAGEKKEFYPLDPVTWDSQVRHIKLFDPLDELHGMGPATPAAREIDSSNDATDWNKSLLQNQGRPGMMYFFPEKMSDDQFKRMKQMLYSEYSGPDNAGKNMILEGARDAKPFGLKPNEMDFLESNRELSRKIAMAYGIPPMLLGIPGDNTYSNYKEAREAFWEETIVYYLEFYKEELNAWLFQDNEIFMDFSLEDIPALAPKRQILWENAQKSDFLTINQKLEMVNKEEIGDEGNQILVPMSMIPLGMVGSNLENEEEDEIEDTEEGDEKMLSQLMKEGYTEEQALNFIGYVYEGESNV